MIKISIAALIAIMVTGCTVESHPSGAGFGKFVWFWEDTNTSTASDCNDSSAAEDFNVSDGDMPKISKLSVSKENFVDGQIENSFRLQVGGKSTVPVVIKAGDCSFTGTASAFQAINASKMSMYAVYIDIKDKPSCAPKGGTRGIIMDANYNVGVIPNTDHDDPFLGNVVQVNQGHKVTVCFPDALEFEKKMKMPGIKAGCL